MAISYVSNALGSTTSTTSFSITLPTTQAGDIMILEFTHRGTGDGTISGTSVTTDGLTWTLKHSQLYSSSTFSGKTYWARATGDHSGKTVTGASLTNSCAAIVTVYRGALSSGDPLADATVVGEQNASANETQAEITTATDGAFVVLVVATSPDVAISSQSCTSPGALTERAERLSTGGTDTAIAHASALKPAAGGTGSFTWSMTDQVSGSWAYAIKPDNPPLTRAIGQYADDEITPIGIGELTTDGESTNVNLVSEHSSTDPITPYIELEEVGTAFNNTATHTNRERTQPQPASDTTSSRRGSQMIYDPDNKRYISFGGYDGTTRYNDVWVKYVDEPHGVWRKISPTGTPPTARNLFGMTLVRGNLTSGGALRSYIVIWGGADPSDKNDMLTLRVDTPGSEVWATVTQTSAPSVRSYLTNHMISTPVSGNSDQNYIYLYGGWASTRENALFRCTFDVDTPTAVTWTTLLSNGAGGNPPQQTGVVLGYKASTSKIYLYGGYNGTTMYNTFWEYDIAGNSWTNTSPSGTAPTASEVAAGGYDAVNNRFWVTGGWTTNGTFSTSLNQIAYINDVGGSESYVIVRANTATTLNQAYAGNSFAGNCIDTDRGLLILRGMATVDSTERYEYAIDLNDGITTDKPVYGVSESESLTARDAMASIWNPVANEWVQIGGFGNMNDNATIARGTHLSDIWVYNPTKETWRYANGGFKTLPPLEGSVGCYDTARDRIILWGGLTGVNENSREVWSLTRDVHGNYHAERLNPTGTAPSARWLGWIAYDAVNDRVITGGGRDVDTLFNDSYSLSFTSSEDGAWTTLSPTGTPPTAVSQPAFFHKQFIDGFEGTSYHPFWDNWGDPNLINYNGKLRMTTGSNADTEYYGMTQLTAWDGTGGFIQMTVDTPQTTDLASTELSMTWSLDANNTVYMNLWNDSGTLKLSAYKRVASTTTSLATVTYNASTMKHWRIRESSGTTYWQYSADKITWTTLHSATNPITMTSLYAELAIGHYSSEAGSSYAIIDNYMVYSPLMYVFGGATNTGATAVSSQLLSFNMATTSGVWATPTSSGGTARRGMAFGFDAATNRLVISHGQDASSALSSTQWFLLSGTTWTTPTISGYIPTARRSTIGMFINSSFYMFGGRPVSGTWFKDTGKLTPNYGTPNNSTWANVIPRYFNPATFKVTGLTPGDNFHWQAWGEV